MKKYNFPALYVSWMEQLLDGRPVPDEPRATCSDCSMCKLPEQITARDRVFNPSTKCCSYIPILPNFLVGGILSDEDPQFAEGKALFQREGETLMVTPAGVQPPWFYWWHYLDKAFGEAEHLRCPYYIDRDGGLCGIWRYRNSRCSTWFCKYERGVFGLDFWTTLSDLLGSVEKKLSDWCVRELDVRIPEQEGRPRQAVWGNWTGREQEFYKQCFQKVSGLNWAEVLELSGTEASALAVDVLKRFQKLVDVPPMPDHLKPGNFTSEDLGNHAVRVWGYRSFDPVDLPEPVFEQIKNGDWKGLEPSLVRRLYEMQILISENEIH
ncbi:hypothetical protein L0222_25440 [bacterium]|nr:hypothetical protein [bacterium]MCI0601883.1 hypothetical protein [bacterium]